MDAEKVARQLVRALRGRRSQDALSKRLGYRSNVISTWECGESHPTAAKLFVLARAVGRPASEALRDFYRRPPSWLDGTDLTTAEGVARFLEDLRGRRAIGSLASAMGRDRFAVSRWLRGQAEPRLPEFLRFVEVCTLRLPDFVAAFVDPTLVDEVSAEWRALEAARRSAYDLPWSHAVLRMMELSQYRKLERHVPGFFASRLGITTNDEREAIALLVGSGLAIERDGRYEPVAEALVDTRADPRATRHLAAFWMDYGAKQLREEGPGNFAFNVFSVDEASYRKIQELQRNYFADLRAAVAASGPPDRAAVATFQLSPFDEND